MMGSVFGFVESVRLVAESIDPRLWPFSLAVFVGFAYWVWRKIHPASFEQLPARLKALPGALIAAVISGLSGQEIGSFILDVVLGSLGATGGHEFIQRVLVGSKEARVLKKAKEAS